MTVSHTGNRITIGRKSLEFEQNIKKVLELRDRVIVLLDDESYPKSDPQRERNVLSFSQDGAMLSRIERSKCRMRQSDGTPIPCPYVGMRIAQDGKTLVVYDVAGACYEFDPETG